MGPSLPVGRSAQTAGWKTSVRAYATVALPQTDSGPIVLASIDLTQKAAVRGHRRSKISLAPSPHNKKRPLALAFLATLLLLSLAGNAYLWRLSETLYTRINLLRQDPVERDKFDPGVAQGQRPTWLVFGDSRAKQWIAPAGWQRPAFVNAGIGGQTSTQVLGRYEAHVKPLRPRNLLVQVGINDIKWVGLSPTSAAAVVKRYQDNINALIRKTREDRIQLVLTTVFPPAEPSLLRRRLWNTSAGEALAQINDFLRTAAAPGVRVIDAAVLLARPDGFLDSAYAADFLHLNPAGYRRLNQALLRR